jgi:hypothetical protein
VSNWLHAAAVEAPVGHRTGRGAHIFDVICTGPTLLERLHAPNAEYPLRPDPMYLPWLICSLVHKFGGKDEDDLTADVESYVEELKKALPRRYLRVCG